MMIKLVLSTSLIISICHTFIHVHSSTIVSPLSKPSPRVVILGAGPVGLGCSTMLKQIGFDDVTVIERRDDVSFDTEKAYLYLIDGRGQTLTDMIGITSDIAAKGISNREFTNITEVLPNGNVFTRNLSVSSSTSTEKYWISRDNTLRCFLSAARTASVNTLYSHNVLSIDWNQDDDCIYLTCSTSNNSSVIIAADVLIGCDGFRSRTRDFLVNMHTPNSAFTPVSRYSDSSGLLYKILSISADFKLPNGEKSIPSRSYLIRSTGRSALTRLSLGLLPVKSDTVRTANIIAPPKHQIWKCRSTEEVQSFLEKSFPQLSPINYYFPMNEIARFASLKPGNFPIPSTTMKCQSPLSSKCLVLLMGDAMHSFPPDLGQGVNSGLADVVALKDALEAHANDFIAAAVDYEKKQIPESEALVNVMAYGYPYQYGHMPLKGKLALLNFAFRAILSKALPKVFSPPACFMIQNKLIPYSQVHKRASATTKRIVISTGTIIAIMALPFLRRCSDMFLRSRGNLFC